jgi:hypothetical protein
MQPLRHQLAHISIRWHKSIGKCSLTEEECGTRVAAAWAPMTRPPCDSRNSGGLSLSSCVCPIPLQILIMCALLLTLRSCIKYNYTTLQLYFRHAFHPFSPVPCRLRPANFILFRVCVRPECAHEEFRTGFTRINNSRAKCWRRFSLCGAKSALSLGSVRGIN